MLGINAPYLLSAQHITVSFFGLIKMFNTMEFVQAFAMFDDDNSGTISLEEMMMLISKIGGNLTEGEAVGLIRQHKQCVDKIVIFLSSGKRTRTTTGSSTRRSSGSSGEQ